MPHPLIMNQLTSEVKVILGENMFFSLSQCFFFFHFEMNYLEHWKMLISELPGTLYSPFKIFILNRTFTF